MLGKYPKISMTNPAHCSWYYTLSLFTESYNLQHYVHWVKILASSKHLCSRIKFVGYFSSLVYIFMFAWIIYKSKSTIVMCLWFLNWRHSVNIKYWCTESIKNCNSQSKLFVKYSTVDNENCIIDNYFVSHIWIRLIVGVVKL
jgi:hypothetical protein